MYKRQIMYDQSSPRMQLSLLGCFCIELTISCHEQQTDIVSYEPEQFFFKRKKNKSTTTLNSDQSSFVSVKSCGGCHTLPVDIIRIQQTSNRQSHEGPTEAQACGSLYREVGEARNRSSARKADIKLFARCCAATAP